LVSVCGPHDGIASPVGERSRGLALLGSAPTASQPWPRLAVKAASLRCGWC
jgi:hypothetical protein